MHRAHAGCSPVERSETRRQPIRRFGTHYVRLGEDEEVGYRRLLARHRVLPELPLAELGIDRRHHAIEHVPARDTRIREQEMHDRRRIREPARFDDDAREARDLSAQAPVMQVLEGLGEPVAHGTAQAAGIEQDDVLATAFDEQVVEADRAELVDDHRGILHRRGAYELREQRGLAASEKAGQQRDRNALGHLMAGSGSRFGRPSR